MSRFESIVFAFVAAGILAVNAPAFPQITIHISDDQQAASTPPSAPKVVAKAKGSKSSRVAEPSPPKEPETPNCRATGGFETSKEKAIQSAERAAIEEVSKYLAEKGEPVRKPPTLELVRRMILAGQEAFETEQIPSESASKETMFRATVALKIRDSHVRELRSRERSSESLWMLAGAGGLAMLVALFFRVDTWSKGYLTSWLLLGTVGTVALTAGLWWWAK